MTNQARKAIRSLFLAILGLFLLTAGQQGFSQDTNATLSGTVTDPSGAIIPGATLSLVNVATGFKSSFISDASGAYTFQNLTPGRYDLAVTANGFKSENDHGIELAVNQAGHLDVHLTVGQTDQTITVTGDASVINYQSQSLEGGVSPEALQDFPLVVSGAPRSSVAVAIMLPGVTTAGSGNAFNARINGGLITGDEAIVDGATTMEGYMNQSGMVALQTDFGMSPDITSEVHVLTANYDAQYGNTTSGQLIIQTKSGGEQFHGAAYEYLRNQLFNAFEYGAARNANEQFVKPQDEENDYGANIGGPMYLPHLHGANSFFKGYFYFNWEGYKDLGGSAPATLTILSQNDRTGNFVNWGSQLYYPNDSNKYGANAGKPIPNNQIDPTYEDPIAKAFIADLPTPTNNAEINNYLIPKSGQGSLTAGENVYFARADMNIGSRDHLYYTYWWQYTGVNQLSDLPVAISTASPASPENAPIQRFNWEHTLSSRMTNHLTLGYLNRNEGYFALNGKADLPTVPGVASSTGYHPEMAFGSYYSQLGDTDPATGAGDVTTRGTYAFNDVFTVVAGRHTLKAGLEYRLAGTSIHEATNEGGTFTFNADTTGSTLCPSGATCPGDPAASFFLGAVGGANVSYYNVDVEYPRQPGWAIHGGDSWRFTSKLTLDYSLRWDYIAPFHEKYNNLSFFDPVGLNPGAVTLAGTELPGRLAFAGNKWGAASYGAPYPEIPFKAAFAPRVGFAYTLNEKTVVRAGYGLYYGQAFYPGWNGGMSQDGFNKTLTLNESVNGLNTTPALYLTTGISSAQVGTTKNISSSFDNGGTPSMYRPLDGNKRPYSQQWNFTIERELPHNFFAALSYVGTKGTHLPSELSPLNVLNPNNPAIAALGTDLDVSYNSPNGPATFAKDNIFPTAGWNNQPYVGWASQMTSCAPTIAQALVPYPMFCGNLQGENEEHATSQYESFQAKVERHLTNGLYLLSALTVQKLFTDAADTTQATNSSSTQSQFSPFNLFPRAWTIAPDNVPVTLQISVVYDLPIGHGKQFLNSGGVSNVLLGGWQATPLYRYEYGTPFAFNYTGSGCATSQVGALREGCVPGILPGQLVELHGRNGYNPKSGAPYLNPNAFESNFTTFGYTGVGKAVTTVYGPSYKDLDLAFTKNTKITEKANFKFSANFFNTFNNHYFANSQGGNYGGPSAAFVTDVSSSSFGTWNGSVTNPRTIQFAGRIEF
jgi:Carboxypeptidase regulatory-like domain